MLLIGWIIIGLLATIVSVSQQKRVKKVIFLNPFKVYLTV